MLILALVSLIAAAGDQSPSGHFTEYEYDDSGQIIGITTVVDEAPPEASYIDPAIVRRGPPVSAAIFGGGLRQSQIETGHPGLSVAGITSSATWVSFELTADESVPLGTQTLTLTTSLGSDTVDVEIYPRLPGLDVSPDPVATTPDGQLELGIGIDSPDVIDHVFELSVAEPSVASISHGAVVIEAGQLTPQATVTLDGWVLGSTALHIETDEIADRQIPVYVTDPWQPSDGSSFYSRSVGVHVGQAPTPLPSS